MKKSTISGNGFSKLLVNNWLLKKNVEYYDFNTKTVDIESLSMTLNVWIGMASERVLLGDWGRDEQCMEVGLTSIIELDMELMKKAPIQIGHWMIKMRSNDLFYIEYHNRLLKLVKDTIYCGWFAPSQPLMIASFPNMGANPDSFFSLQNFWI